MKTLKFLSLFCLLLLCLSACQDKPYPHTMRVADTLVYTQPDSACLLLEQLEDSILTAPRSTQMYYRLLCIKARDKAYITHTSDSLIQQVLRYYEKKNDKKHLPEAYYYGGRVYADLGDAPQALGYYQKAAEMLEGSADYRLLKVIYSQMGELFLYQDVYEEAMKAYKKAYQYNTYINDHRGIVINLCDIGVTFTAYGNADSALYYYQKAYEHANKYKCKQINKVKHHLASLYIQLEQFDSAQVLLQSIAAPSPLNQSAIYSITAELYQKTNRLETVLK